MADGPFDTTPIGFMERPRSEDINQQSAQSMRTIRELMRAIYSLRSGDSSPGAANPTGFYGDGLRVVETSPETLAVTVSAGFGFVNAAADVPTDIGTPDIVGLDDLAPIKPVFLLAPHTFPVSLPSGGNSRIDIIEVKPDRRLENLIARHQFDASLEEFVPKSYYKTLAFGLDGRTGTVTSPAASTAGLSYKLGVESGSPVAPSVTAGYVKIAEVRVSSADVNVQQTSIGDFRKLLAPGGVLTASCRFRLQWSGGAPVVSMSDVIAPPGVEIGAIGLNAQRSRCIVYCKAGAITKATAIAMVEKDSLGDTTHTIKPTLRFLGAADLSHRSIMQSCTPPIHTAIDAAYTRLEMETKFADANGVVGASDSSLEDVSYVVQFQLAYH